MQKSLLNYSRILKRGFSLKVLKKGKVVWLFKLLIKHKIFCTDFNTIFIGDGYWNVTDWGYLQLSGITFKHLLEAAVILVLDY